MSAGSSRATCTFGMTMVGSVLGAFSFVTSLLVGDATALDSSDPEGAEWLPLKKLD